jgi:hypothetical protein
MNMNASLVLSAGLIGVTAATPIAASQTTTKELDALTFRFEAKAGAEYASNVAVTDLDANAGQGDWAGTLNLLAEATWRPADRLTLRLGYDGSETKRQELDAFDLGIHRGYGEAAYDFDAATFGVLGNLAEAYLAGEGYLTYTQIAPYISKQFGDRLFLRASYAASEKMFEDRPRRDATSDSVQLDAYVFLDGARRYVSLGLRGTEEDARTAELDYSAALVRGRFVQRVGILGQEVTVRAGAEYEDREYDKPTPSIGAPRSDQRAVVDALVEVPFGDTVFSELSYRYGDYASNLSSADYDEHVAAIRLGVRY